MCEEKPFKSTYAADGTELPPKEIWEQMDNEFMEESFIPKISILPCIKRFRQV